MTPRLTWLEGSWVVLDTTPDGDTLQFLPDKAAEIQITFDRLHWNRCGTFTVRLYGIDTPETHYLRRGQPVVRQPYPWGELAAQHLLDFLGLQAIHFSPAGRIVDGDSTGCRGRLALVKIDRYGRAVGLACRPHLRLDALSAWLTSANLSLIQTGYAWPLFHGPFPKIWLPSLLQALQEARLQRRGLWPHDLSHLGFPWKYDDWPSLQRTHLIWPFLFRRLADTHARIMKNPALTVLSSLDRAMGRVTLSRSGCRVRFVELLQCDPHQWQLLVAPEEIILSP